jgi:DNA-binding NtrC family response regulator
MKRPGDAATAVAGPPIVGESEPIQQMCALIDALARHDCTVLIQGESGTGKELAARQIHTRSPRRASHPFVPVDCTTLSGTLLESQLFGHVRGAFTGAQSSTLGFIRAADGGTLFLDEIGELELSVQAKLLRCIQERAVVPLGQTAPIRVNVRILTATHRDLRDMVRRGTFREDLFYRLNVACLHVPPLRQRKQDIPLLVTRTLQDLCALYGNPPMTISSAAMALLCAHDWPGNVRELINAVEHAMVFSPGCEIGPAELPVTVLSDPRKTARPDGIIPLREAERDLIRRTLHATNGNQSRAAHLLDIERHRLHRRIVEYGLEDLIRQRTR